MGPLITGGLLIPLLGFALVPVAGPDRRLVKLLGPGVVALSFACFLAATVLATNGPVALTLYQWLPAVGSAQGAPVPQVGIDLYFDRLASVMTLVITGVGFLIHLYSVGYMDGENDRDYARFFSQMNFFIFSMLLLVLARNFVVLVVGWALVGLSSYLLIGFWNDRPAAVAAARKAFVMNVIGDVGIVIGSFVALRNTHSLGFGALFGASAHLTQTCGLGCSPIRIDAGTAELIAFLLLVGAVAKSAQIPLHTWLPDAMEGPTPVSALIHAATMVTAGVYLLARMHPLFAAAPMASATAACIGAATALMAALLAFVQTDIKRVLAYSTMSQVGYMFFAVAAGAEVAGIFHLVTHAFFKALLFLAAGSVIHALHGEQDMRKMGGLFKELPVTGWTFLAGALALAGIPPLSGAFSKDEIIGGGLQLGPIHPWLGGLLVAVAGLTGFYVFRATYLAFFAPRAAARQDTHEPGLVMQAPVLVLAGLAAVAGLLQPWGIWHGIGDYLGPVLASGFSARGLGATLLLAVFTLFVVGAGAGAAYMRCSGLSPDQLPALRDRGPLGRRFFWDDAYQALVVAPAWSISGLIGRVVEPTLVVGGVDAAATMVRSTGQRLRALQSGFVRSYSLLFAAAALLALVLAGLSWR